MGAGARSGARAGKRGGGWWGPQFSSIKATPGPGEGLGAGGGPLHGPRLAPSPGLRASLEPGLGGQGGPWGAGDEGHPAGAPESQIRAVSLPRPAHPPPAHTQTHRALARVSEQAGIWAIRPPPLAWTTAQADQLAPAPARIHSFPARCKLGRPLLFRLPKAWGQGPTWTLPRPLPSAPASL